MQGLGEHEVPITLMALDYEIRCQDHHALSWTKVKLSRIVMTFWSPAFKIESLNRVSDGFEVLTVSVYLAATIPTYSLRLSLGSLANIFAWDFA